MATYLFSYLATLFTLAALDSLWLGIIMRSFYANHIGHLMAAAPNLPAAAIFYLLYPAGLILFAVQPNLSTSPMRVAILSALYGFFAYAVYDLTNQATLKDWPLAVTLTDILWGTCVSMLMGLAAYATARYFMR